jgi:CRISPR-associated protein Csb1
MATLKNEHRLLLQADLQPWQGTRFRPTGFPDLGPAEYMSPTGACNLLVESVQSVANRLETAIWDPLRQDLIEPLRGLPYIRLQHPELGLITSLTESHRIASAYLFPSLENQLVQEMGGRPRGQWDPAQLARALLKMDPGSLLHGAFLVRLKPVARLTRLVSGFIEARDVSVAQSGGVRLDRLDASGPSEEGMGHIIYAVREYSSDNIAAYFSIDLLRLRSYGLSEQAQQLLLDLALLKIRRFLDRGLRLRATCDFQAGDLRATHPAGYQIPAEKELAKRLSKAITTLRANGELGPLLVLEA